jgi:para-nitrobenzyl esterase
VLFPVPGAFDLTWETLPAALAQSHTLDPSTDVAQAIALYRAKQPNIGAPETYFQITTERGMGRGSRKLAGLKAAQPAKAYLYKLGWYTPVEGGRWRAPHSLDLPLVFDTVANSDSILGSGAAEAQQVSEVMSAAWTNFARTGDPNGAGVPEWRTYAEPERETMVFNVDSACVRDPRGDELRAIKA